MNNNEDSSVRLDKLDIVATGIYSKGTMDMADELNKLKPFLLREESAAVLPNNTRCGTRTVYCLRATYASSMKMDWV
jgi:hypothetical protein